MSTSILDKLSIAQIIDFYFSSEDKNKTTITVQENCDNYYNIILNKTELLQLAKEIEELANTMRNSNG